MQTSYIQLVNTAFDGNLAGKNVNTLEDLAREVDNLALPSGDMTKAVYDTDNDGVVDAAETAGTATSAGTATLALDSNKLAGTTPTSAGLALLDDADAAAQRATLGLRSLATRNLAVLQRVMSESLTMEDGESLVIVRYLDIASFDLTMNGDSEIEIL